MFNGLIKYTAGREAVYDLNKACVSFGLEFVTCHFKQLWQRRDFKNFILYVTIDGKLIHALIN